MTFNPGIYKATVRGVPNQVVLVDDTEMGHVGIEGHVSASGLTDARPLIVLDLTGAQFSDLRDALDRWIDWSSLTTEKRLIRDFLDQIEAQTKPPRIEEPGLWGVVESDRNRYVRYSMAGQRDWADLLGQDYPWAAIGDPTLIREGLS